METAQKDLITRTEAARIIGVTTRTVDRYVTNKYLTRHRDARGQVRLSARECRAMTRFEPEAPAAATEDERVE